MSSQVIHQWKPSYRLIRLIEKNKGRIDLIIDPDTAIFRDVYKERLAGKVNTRIYMCFQRACHGTPSYPAMLTWGEFIRDLYDDAKKDRFYCIRNFGEKSLNELRRALSKERYSMGPRL